jgi:hypothetical protein
MKSSTAYFLYCEGTFISKLKQRLSELGAAIFSLKITADGGIIFLSVSVSLFLSLHAKEILIKFTRIVFL